MEREHGYSLLELTLATWLTMLVTGCVFALLNPSHGSFRAEPEAADVQQRLRVAADTLYRHLVMAGGGSYSGPNSGSLDYFFAPVLPFQQGPVGGDPAGTCKTDTITVVYVPPTPAQTTIAQDMPAQSAELKVAAGPGCPSGDEACGFKSGMTALVYDDTGSYDTFTIANVQSSALLLQHNLEDSNRTYAAGTKIVQAESHTYYLKIDNATSTYQLMQHNGSSGADVPVVDHVVGLAFDYFGEPQPPAIKKPLADPTGPWTTYGPKPPALGVKTTDYEAGENCTFRVDAVSGLQVPRLDVLGAGDPALVKLTRAELTDGPWCPDVTNPNRFDADLLRIRKIGVTIRVESAVSALRGPASVLFAHSGTSRGGTRWVPDQEIRFQVSPRNLNLGR